MNKDIMVKRCGLRGQISVEYLMIIAISFAVLIPTGYFFYKYSQTSGEGAIRSQINQLGNKIISSAESIYGLADGSIIKLDVNYLSNIRDIKILESNELIITYELSSGIGEAVFFSRIPLSGVYNLSTPGPPFPICNGQCVNSSFSEDYPTAGRHTLKLESKTSYVQINMTI
jgi:uncharacterized protein (UPF0333 family)